MQREHSIRCMLSRHDARSAEDCLGLEINGVHHEVVLKIAELAEKLVQDLPPVMFDLIEIAACVYGADSAIPRGGPAALGMGKHWRRNLRFEIPVRVPDLWNAPTMKTVLLETLGFLSDDLYDFTFTENPAPRSLDSHLDFGSDKGFAAEEVILFSGGLDSLAGALDELMSRGKSVALVSHHSATKIARVQRELIQELKRRTSRNRILHVPVTVHLKKGANREATHRTRSFLFAALGIATARIFELNRLRFYENGVVSLNLPPVGQVIGARATRTTHPRSLKGFGRLFSALFGKSVRVENPFIWRTKCEVIEVIAQHNASDLIRMSHSCADVHHRTVMEPHCGRCSQCIDRRFAVLAAGLGTEDPGEAYAVDLFTGPRRDVRDREMALSYLRHARRLRAMTDREFMAKFGEVSRALSCFDEPPAAVARRIHDLHRRHGETVASVMDGELQKAMSSGEIARLDPDCLMRLAGVDMFGAMESDSTPIVQSGVGSLPTLEVSAISASVSAGRETFVLTMDATGRKVEIVGLGKVSGATAAVLSTLAEKHLEAAGEGRSPADYPYLRTAALAKEMSLAGDASVRKRINRARGVIRRMAARVSRHAPEPDAIIENIAWKGYRLNPWRVRVFRR